MDSEFGSRLVESAEAMHRLGVEIGVRCAPGLRIGLVGEFGAGKTTLVRGIAEGMGVTVPIASPTYAIVEDHGILIHVDWCRIEDEVELGAIDFDAYTDSDGVVVVEWADRFPRRLGDDALILRIAAPTAETRRVVAEGSAHMVDAFAVVFPK